MWLSSLLIVEQCLELLVGLGLGLGFFFNLCVVMGLVKVAVWDVFLRRGGGGWLRWEVMDSGSACAYTRMARSV